MKDNLTNTGERVLPGNIDSVEEYLVYLRHLVAYEYTYGLIPANLEWLEIGSGEGYGTSLLSDGAKSIVGLDIHEAALTHATEKYGSDNCSFRSYDGLTLPFETGTFDAVVSFQVIEHIEDDRNYVAEAYRVLRPGGWFAVTTPNRAYRLKPEQPPWNRYHVREYYARELHEVLASSFADVTVKGVKGKGEAQRIELKRVQQGFHDLDRFNLRRLVPAPLRPSLGRLVRRLTGRTMDTVNVQAAYTDFTTADFFVIETDIDSSLDLLGICRKR